MRNRKGDICVVEKLDLIKGRVQGHPDGFGFLIPDDGSPDVFLSAKEMHKVLHGDHVMVRETGVDRRGRREGAIVEVLERARNAVGGKTSRGSWNSVRGGGEQAYQPGYSDTQGRIHGCQGGSGGNG